MAGNIPTYNSDVPNVTSIPAAQASAEDFGAGIGRALEDVGSGLGRLSAAMKARKDQQDGIEGDLALAKGRQDMTETLIKAENSPDAGSPEFTTNFNKAFDEYQAKVYDTLPNNQKVRDQFQIGMARLRATLSSHALNNQVATGAAVSTQKVKDGLSAYVNTIATDPSQYDEAIAGGNKLIDGLALPPDAASKLRDNFTDTAIAGRFDALFRAAKSPEAVSGIIDDLEHGPWKSRMSADKYHDLLKLGDAAKKSMQTFVNTQATAAVQSVEDRIKGGAAIDPTEMEQVGAIVKQSNSIVTHDKWMRLRVQNDTAQRTRRLSTPELNRYIDTNRGGHPVPTAASPSGRARTGYSYLKSRYGLDDAAALGVLANVGRETGFNPRPGDGGTSDGYFQWHADRLTAAQAAGATGTDITRAIDYAMSEPEGRAWLAKAKAGEFQSAAEAAQSFMEIFEKPANPNTDQMRNEQWTERLAQVINNGRPLSGDTTSGFPTEYAWVRADAAADVKQRRDKLVNAGDMMTAAQEAGLFSLDALDDEQSFRTRAAQSVTAQRFLAVPEDKPFTPAEVASFDQIIKRGTLDDKLSLLQNISSMGSVSADAFKQIGEKAPVFNYVGGLATVSPGVAHDVLAGVQAFQDNPDLEASLGASIGGPGSGGTAAVFASLIGPAMDGALGTGAYAARKAADALYVSRVGTGATWSPDVYEQAVRDVLGARPGDPDGGIVTINGQTTLLPPGVDGTAFETAIARLTEDDLTSRSIGGSPPRYADGTIAAADDIAEDGQFRAYRGVGMYSIDMGDGKPLAGSGPGGLYIIHLDAASVQEILARKPAEGEDRATPSQQMQRSLLQMYPGLGFGVGR